MEPGDGVGEGLGGLDLQQKSGRSVKRLMRPVVILVSIRVQPGPVFYIPM